MDSEPSQSSRRALLVGVVAVHLVWCFLEVLARLGQEYAGVHSEELANPWMARMLLEGHWGSWSELRYRSFCGGCGIAGGDPVRRPRNRRGTPRRGAPGLSGVEATVEIINKLGLHARAAAKAFLRARRGR